MTDRRSAGHEGSMQSAVAVDLSSMPSRGPIGAPQGRGRVCFAEVYDAHFDFVYRSVRRLGAREDQVDDAVQDVFIVVHRRLDAFEGRSTLKTWLFGIAMRVVADHRRRSRRKERPTVPLRESVIDAATGCPHEAAKKGEAVRILHTVLDLMDDDRRAVFVMAELEQMSAPEIADTLGVKLNTVYSRLRAARATFELAIKRYHVREGGAR